MTFIRCTDFLNLNPHIKLQIQNTHKRRISCRIGCWFSQTHFVFDNRKSPMYRDPIKFLRGIFKVFFWPDKCFSLIDDVAEFNIPGFKSDFLSINAFNSMARVDTVENSLDKLCNFQNQIVGAMTEFRAWGKDSPIQTFDLSGFPISSSAVRAFGILSRLQIPQDWPQVTSKDPQIT